MGAEKPYEGRLRIAAEGHYLTLEVGEDATLTELAEARVDGLLFWSPVPDYGFSFRAPVVMREATASNLTVDRAVSLGDVEVLGRLFVFQDRPFGARHLISVLQGFRFPTAPEQVGTDGAPLTSDLQTGGGAFEPLAGLGYAWFPRPFSVYFNTIVNAPLATRFDFTPGASIRSSIGTQWQIANWVAVRADVDGRLDDVERTSMGAEPDTGGFVAFVSPRLLLQPIEDVLLTAGVGIPVAHVDTENRREGVIFRGGVALDI